MTEERSSDSNKLIKNSSNDKFKDQTGDKNQVEMSILKVSKRFRGNFDNILYFKYLYYVSKPPTRVDFADKHANLYLFLRFFYEQHFNFLCIAIKVFIGLNSF